MRIKYLQPSEVQGLLNAAERLEETLQTRILYNGFRVSGMLRLRTSDFKPDENVCTVLVKGGKLITMILDPDTSKMLKWYLKDNNIQYGRIFKIKRETVYHRLVKLGDLSGYNEKCECCSQYIKKVHPHMLRHSFAINALDGVHLFMKKPMTLREVQLQLGHSKVTTTERYLQYTTKHRKEVFV